MATKTLTITEDAYNLLTDRKMDNESFSEEIKRVFSKKNTRRLSDFFGILSNEEGKAMLSDLEKIRSRNIDLISERIK